MKNINVELVNLPAENGFNHCRIIVGHMKSGVLIKNRNTLRDFNDILDTYVESGLTAAISRCEWHSITLFED